MKKIAETGNFPFPKILQSQFSFFSDTDGIIHQELLTEGQTLMQCITDTTE
jgi:hypothetical protein